MSDLRYALNAETRKTATLRDALSECLAELPDSPKWYPHQELYVLTDPESSDYPDIGADLAE